MKMKASSLGLLLQDLQHSVRLLRERPAYTATIILSLMLGVGANCAVFSVIDAALLRPLPFPNDGRLARIFSANPSLAIGETGASYADFADWESQSHSFESLAGYASGGAFLTGDGQAERVGAAGVTGKYFDVMGTQALVGRVLNATDEQPKAVVISYGLWKRRYGGREDILGRALTFNGVAASIVGVMPPFFDYPQGIDLWTVGVERDSPRSSRGLGVVGRLRPGVGARQAQVEMATIASHLADAYPQSNSGWQVRVVSLRDLRGRGTKNILLISLAAAALLLLIACANIGTLQLVRAAERRQEIGMRFVLGATRGRIARLLLVEGLLLSLTGTGMGLLVAFWSIRILLRSGLVRFAGVSGISLDSRILAFAVAVAIIATVLFTLAPARYSLALSPASVITEAGRTTTPGHVHQTYSWIVAGQLALVLVMLVTTSLLTRSFTNILHVNLGFDPKGVLTGRVANLTESRLGFFKSVIDGVRALPGVSDAAGSYSVPLDSGGAYWRQAIIVPQDRPPSPDFQVAASYHIISPGYFRLLRIVVSDGRDFAETDTTESQPVAIINRRLADRIWPGEHAVGRRIVCCEENQPREVVGLVSDLKSASAETPPEAEIYVPLSQDTQVSMRLLVRASGDLRTLIPAVRATIASVDPNWPLYDVHTMEEMYDSGVAPRRSQLILVGSFVGLAVVLSVLGVYGAFTYTSAGRSREIAIRVALGASQMSVLQLVLWRALSVIASGIVVGIALAVVAGRIIRGSLFGVSAFAPGLYVKVTALLACVAFLCSLIPAFRASRADPLPTLREQ